MAGEQKVLYEFGPFRVDPDKQTLLRADQPVTITPKVFETLLILLRRNGSVVTRDDLMKELWPDAFVEESNLSQTIFMLRKALGETPENRQYILTVPGRGYRFAAEVRAVSLNGEYVLLASQTRSKLRVEQAESEADIAVKALPTAARSKTWWKYSVAVAAVVVLFGLGLIVLLRWRRPAVLGERGSVLVANFVNSTGDPVFDDTLRQGLMVQLEQSPYLEIVPENRIQQTLELMGRPRSQFLNSDVAREICERIGASLMLSGSITALGSQYVLSMRAEDCHRGRVLDVEQEQAMNKEDVLSALSRMAENFRSRAGESAASLRSRDVPLEEATTSSLEALELYSTGVKVIFESGESAAIPFVERAVQVDPHFAVAHATLGVMYGTNGQLGLSVESARKAHELRDHASERERFFIDAYYDGRATGNQEKAQTTCLSWERMYPRDPMPYGFLSGFVFPVLGQHGQAVEQAREALKLNPQSGIGFSILVNDLFAFGDLKGAKQALAAASDRKASNPQLPLMAYEIAFLDQDDDGMESAIAEAQSDSEAKDWMYDQQAFRWAYSGHLRRAESLWKPAIDMANEAGDEERAVLFQTKLALTHGWLGDEQAAQDIARSALPHANSRETQFGLGLALALAGQASKAELIANNLEQEFREDTSVRFNYVPTIRAVVAISRNRSSMALQILQIASPYELGRPRSSINGFFGALYPVYVRGQAYLAERRGAEAAAEFQKIVDHPGIVVSDPIGALANLQLGRAYALAGDHARAKSSYDHFLTLWNSADPDVPVLKQAKAEYARLR
jgi:DNA-binding winged helix-turn-helix (wHTH) protein